MIAENYRYSEENNILRDLVAAKEIGDIVYFVRNDVTCFPCQMQKDTFAATEWRQHPQYKGGDILDAALHDIAAMRHIFGAVHRLQAFGRSQDIEYSPYRSVHINMLFKSGVIGQFSYFPGGKEVQRPLIGTRIFGDKGTIYLEEKACGAINVFYNDGGHKLIPYKPMRGYYNEFLNFYNALQGVELLGVTPEMEFGDVRMVFDVLRSIEEGSVVSVDKTDQFVMR
jgi:predicted dehydrogenase